jgi:hypothetical protein
MSRHDKESEFLEFLKFAVNISPNVTSNCLITDILTTLSERGAADGCDGISQNLDG